MAHHCGNAPAPASWTRDDVLAVLWVAMRFLATQPLSARVIQRRLHCADQTSPCLEAGPTMMGPGFAAVPGAGPLLALCSFVANCERDPDDYEWCRAVLHEARVDYLALLATIRPFAHLYSDPDDVPVQHFGQSRDDYELIPLAALPFGHSMQSCGHKELFERQFASIKRRAKWRRWTGKSLTEEQALAEAGRRLVESVAGGAVEPCHLHRPGVDWSRINAYAEHIRTTVTPWNEPAVLAAVAATGGLTDEERNRLGRLFTDPIRWDRGFAQVSGGQHRLCSYRIAGATHAFVRVR